MNISAAATEKLLEFIQDMDGDRIRIANGVSGGACCAKMILGMTMDDSFDDNEDMAISVDGISFVIEKALYERLGGVNVDLDPEKGIVVTGKKQQ